MAQTYGVSGMTCGGCARSVEQAIKAVAPKATVSVDLGAARITVAEASAAEVERAVENAGFGYEGPV